MSSSEAPRPGLINLTSTAGIVLPLEPPEALAALDQAVSDRAAGRIAADAYQTALRAVVRRWPTCLEAWARLGEWAQESGHDVEAFAYYRTGYHRGLDRLRGAGWRGAGRVPWEQRSNQGVLRAIHGLVWASAALGEPEEARRCHKLLLDSDPTDPFGVADKDPTASA